MGIFVNEQFDTDIGVGVNSSYLTLGGKLTFIGTRLELVDSKTQTFEQRFVVEGVAKRYVNDLYRSGNYRTIKEELVSVVLPNTKASWELSISELFSLVYGTLKGRYPNFTNPGDATGEHPELDISRMD